MSERRRIHRVRGDARRFLALATNRAGTDGIDSVDLLAAMLEKTSVVRMIDELSGAAEPLQLTVKARMQWVHGGPGLTPDAKSAIEAAVERALRRGADLGMEDLFIGLATADCEARTLLDQHGIAADALAALLAVESSPRYYGG